MLEQYVIVASGSTAPTFEYLEKSYAVTVTYCTFREHRTARKVPSAQGPGIRHWCDGLPYYLGRTYFRALPVQLQAYKCFVDILSTLTAAYDWDPIDQL